jgi:DinB superfamily
MRYLRLDRTERKALMDGLAVMADFVAARFASISAEEAARGGPDETFSPVEQCWHLADLEREGFGERIRRLLGEEEPFLPDFDGARLARERGYRARRLDEGLAAFRAEREANLALLRSVGSDQWTRAGTQEGVGRVALCDLPSMMAEHDAAHRAEIEAWGRGRG